ncbi:biotin/lipoate A/B protein ligase family protein [uncultured Cohaesibacter sp.]|uniref:lipoate--protein ligase family protein n=1 Tax=uncultured Cohaesibacter sp. TaxID=1002546 RepID=UPI00292F49A8|nr:biotin/lipoate A/B protein ligase family protein [uncultured Cohaesibacter sp.]
MHGEYKVHGGKLVVADLEVVDGAMSAVQIAGDFFLEPAEALNDICLSLEGMPVESSVEDITSKLKKSLPEGAALIGFSLEAIAIAVRRALGVSKSWRDYEWQIIDSEAVSPAMHLALDDVLANEVASGRRAPTLRFWEWDRAAVIVGAFQSLKNEVDLQAAEELNVEIVRRVTGGGAMFVEKGTAITYSLYAPTDLVADMSFADSYAFLDNWVLKALNGLGIDAYYKPLNDITSSKGKIGGAAQKRYHRNTVLHHVTMAYDMDAAKMMQVLRIGREKLSDKGTASAAKRVDPVRSQTGMERRAVIDQMKETFVSLNGGREGQITPEEYAAAEKLVKEKFSTKEWLHHIP